MLTATVSAKATWGLSSQWVQLAKHRQDYEEAMARADKVNENIIASEAELITGSDNFERHDEVLQNAVWLFQDIAVLMEAALQQFGSESAGKALYRISQSVKDLKSTLEFREAVAQQNGKACRMHSDIATSLRSAVGSQTDRIEILQQSLDTALEENDNMKANMAWTAAYVKTVMHERTLWQEKHGANPAHLESSKSFVATCEKTMTFLPKDAKPDCKPIAGDRRDAVATRYLARLELNNTIGESIPYIAPREELALLRGLLEATQESTFADDLKNITSNMETEKNRRLKFVQVVATTTDAGFTKIRVNLERLKDEVRDMKKTFNRVLVDGMGDIIAFADEQVRQQQAAQQQALLAKEKEGGHGRQRRLSATNMVSPLAKAMGALSPGQRPRRGSLLGPRGKLSPGPGPDSPPSQSPPMTHVLKPAELGNIDIQSGSFLAFDDNNSEGVLSERSSRAQTPTRTKTFEGTGFTLSHPGINSSHNLSALRHQKGGGDENQHPSGAQPNPFRGHHTKSGSPEMGGLSDVPPIQDNHGNWTPASETSYKVSAGVSPRHAAMGGGGGIVASTARAGGGGATRQYRGPTGGGSGSLYHSTNSSAFASSGQGLLQSGHTNATLRSHPSSAGSSHNQGRMAVVPKSLENLFYDVDHPQMQQQPVRVLQRNAQIVNRMEQKVVHALERADLLAIESESAITKPGIPPPKRDGRYDDSINFALDSTGAQILEVRPPKKSNNRDGTGTRKKLVMKPKEEPKPAKPKKKVLGEDSFQSWVQETM